MCNFMQGLVSHLFEESLEFKDCESSVKDLTNCLFHSTKSELHPK